MKALKVLTAIKDTCGTRNIKHLTYILDTRDCTSYLLVERGKV